ncbi:hypothetical protein MKW94_017322 [Papaver nudicaule]|uniref:Fucosyltransferase n=1 Tax=Papaver nudicaule TaxID=74823 RepID=A0AA41SBG3_PAPNU|nr:hypothetical protein [Papaver nudicaule]
MDMKRPRKQLSPENPKSDSGLSRVGGGGEKKNGFSSNVRSMGILLLILPVLVLISVVYRNPPLNRFSGFVQARELEVFTQKEGDSSKPLNEHKDKLLDGLLSAGFDEESCQSRYESALYRTASPHKPSTYLLERLRSYEALHKRCGPYTESYNKTVEKLRSGHAIEPTDCNYLVWVSFSGLGNRILTLASAFLYALLTNRVLLVDRGKDMADLFCEPFPEMSWLLPLDFPLNQFDSYDQKFPQCYGNMLKKKILNKPKTSLPSFMYLHLVHDYDDHDKLFFCDQDQALLQKIPWLIMKTDNYFAPSLFLIHSFEEELSNLFPNKGTVFHHLGRYLFHPSNPVWGLITRYYQAYLGNADERLGIQVRVFDTGTGPFQHVLDQILACALKEKLLPEVNKREPIFHPTGSRKSKAVLLTSLSAGYFESIRDMYWEYPAANGEVISVYQPSHEEYQQTEKKNHNRKALAEMYLLSFSDKLITSSWSTFGYVAQSLGGLTPWILKKPENKTVPDPPCFRDLSMEPCFHAPPFYDCKAKTGIDTGEIVPHVRHCADMTWGLKLVERNEL